MPPLLATFYFWGLPASTVAAIFAGVGALIVGLYILKLRRRRLEVPFVGFWQQISKDASTSRLFRNLRRWLSLLLALCIAALLVLALGDPRLFAEREPNRLIIVLDVSASMGATSAGTAEKNATTRFAEAQDKAKELVASMRAADRAVVIAAGAGPKPLTGLTDRHPVLIQAIDEATPSGESLDLGKTLRVAADLAAGAEQARVVVLSDGGYVDDRLRVPQGLDLSFIHVGGEITHNVGITAMSARLHPLDARRNQVFVELQSSRKDIARVELTLRTAGRTLSAESVTLQPGQRIQRTLDDLGGLSDTLSAEITPKGFEDALPADNQAHLVLPERKRLRVGVVSEGNLYLQAALLLDEHLDVQEALSIEALGSLDQYDALIFDNVLPPSAPPKPAIYIYPDSREHEGFAPLDITGALDRPFVDKLAKDHPLLRWASLRDVNIASALDTKLQQGDVMVAGDRNAPLLVDGMRTADDGTPQRFFALLFDPRQSDLPLRAAWPLLLISALDTLIPQNTDSRGSCTAGQACFVADETAPRTFAQTGIISVDDKKVAVNVDPREATLQSRSTLEGAKSDVSSAKVEPASDRLWVWLVALALLTLCIEWWTLQRRRTV